MPRDLRILLLEDSEPHAELIELMLREGGMDFTAVRADSKEGFQAELEARLPDLILSDYALPSFDGWEALSMARHRAPDVPFIFVTGTLGEEVAIETLKSGATDYVLKTRLSRLVPAVERALREAEERRQRKRAVEKLRQSHQQLRALTAHLQRVREEERTRIAREVHDELGQALTGLKLDVSWLAGQLPRKSRSLLERARSMASQIDATIQTVRRIATELRPGILDDLGLAAAVEWQANEFQNRTGIPCEVRTDIRDDHRGPECNTAVFRIFQELLTNIARHARARRVAVQLMESDGRIILEVRDDGRGITDEELSSPLSVGLLGMRERAELLGGEITFTGRPGEGTTVIVRLPLPRPGSESSTTYENPDSGRSRGGPAGP